MTSPPTPARGLARGLAVGLWILAGFTFLVRWLLPHAFGGNILAPALLALAVLATALLPDQTSRRKALRPLPRISRALLYLLGGMLATGTALVIVREGDTRSFLFVGLAAALSLLLARTPSRRF